MADRLSGFTTPDARARYLELYDRFVAERWPVPFEGLEVRTRFGPTYVRRSGSGGDTPLVLVHPTSGSSLAWHSVIAPLAERHTVYTPDTIGTAGRSSQTAPVRSEADLSRWLDDVLDALGLDAVHLVGYSEGGWIATVHAACSARRDRLVTLTLVEPGGGLERVPPTTVVRLVLRALAVLRAKDKATAMRRFSSWLNGDVPLSDAEVELGLHTFASFRQRLPRPRRLPDDALRGLETPTLLLLGGQTVLFDPAKVAARAERLLPDVTVDITPGAGHGLLFQHPERLTATVLDFVERRGRRPGRLP